MSNGGGGWRQFLRVQFVEQDDQGMPTVQVLRFSRQRQEERVFVQLDLLVVQARVNLERPSYASGAFLPAPDVVERHL